MEELLVFGHIQISKCIKSGFKIFAFLELHSSLALAIQFFMSNIYHYTKIAHLDSITRDKFIKPTTVNIGKNEKPAVWLSTNHKWEGTANFSIQESMEFPRRLIFLPIRFRLKQECINNEQVRLATWTEHKASSGIDALIAMGLENVAKQYDSSPGDWLCCYEPIPLSCFDEPEVFDGVNWVEIKQASTILSESYVIPTSKPRKTAKDRKKLVEKAKKKRNELR